MVFPFNSIKMKHTFLTIALLAAATFSFAQQERILLGVESGISIARLSYEKPNLNNGFDSRVGYGAGAAFQYNFSKMISFRTGIMYERKGASADITFTDNSGNVTGKTVVRDNFNYLVVPLMLRVTFGGNTNFYLNAGPYAGILLKRVWKYKDKITLPFGGELEAVDLTDDTEDSEFGIAAGIGVSTLYSEKIVLSFEIRDNKGLTNVSPYDNRVTTNSVLFLAGMAFKFGSKEKDTK